MSQGLSFSILLPVHYKSQKHNHGDFYFGASLAKALGRLGHTTKILAGEEWGLTQANDIALVIRGRAAPTRRMGRLTLQWCISFPPKLNTGEFDCVDHFFAASPPLTRRIRRMVPADQVSLMYQAFDPDLMFADEISTSENLVFVGSPRSKDRRPVVSFAAQSGLNAQVWGPGWEKTEFHALQAGGHVENDKLGHIYRGGTVVLNDHLIVMKRNAIISNRVYDGLACGRAVLTDTVAGLPPDIAPFVYRYEDAESFRSQAELALAEPVARRHERIAFAKKMRDLHSFDQRAQQICVQTQKLLSDRS